MPGGAVYIADSSAPKAPAPRSLREVLPALAVASFAGFGGLLFGYDTGVISGILEMDSFNEDYGRFFDNIPTNLVTSSNPPKPGFALPTSDRSLVVSILSAGTFFGALLAAPLADLLGRKWGLQSAIAIFCGGVAMQCAAEAVPLFAVGRFVAGLSVGTISVLVPLYQSETAPAWIRGAIVSGYQLAITIGLLIASIVNDRTQHRDDKGAYVIPIAIQFAYAIILSFGLFFLPESPRWYIKRGKRDQAAKSLAILNSTDVDSPYVRAEIEHIQTSLNMELEHGSGGYKECFQRNERKHFTRVAVGATLQALQQLTGINFIFYYGTTFFRSTGANNPFIFSIISNVVNVASTLPGMWMMERVGRRNLFIGGAVWMFVAQLIVAAVGTAEPVSNRAAQSAAVAFVCVYIAGFASTWGPGAWVYTGESYPLAIRAKGLSISTGSQWLWNFGIGYATPYLVDQGPGKAGLGPKVFFIWSAACLICIAFSYFFINETSGLTLEEVDILYSSVDPRHSAKFNQELKGQRADVEAPASQHTSELGPSPSSDDKADYDLAVKHQSHSH